MRFNSFERTARAWHAQARKDREWSAGYAEKVMRHLELHIFPWNGALAMEAILPTEVVRCLHRIKERGNLETAQRVREAVQHVFQYAVDVGALDPARNFVNSRTAGLPPPRTRHYAAITDPQKLGQLLRDNVPTTATSSRVTHADVGQMHMYCNYAKENWTLPDEPPGRSDPLRRQGARAGEVRT